MGLENMMKNKQMGKPEPTQDTTKENGSDEHIAAETLPKPKSKKTKRTTLGRPRTKTEDEKIINIAVPISVYEKMNLAKLQYNNNLTLYINKLIEQDLKKNLAKYKEKILDI